jgi:nitroreductase
MDAMEAIFTRRSVRAYTDEPVTEEELGRLLEAAVHAPTGMGTEPWVFGIIEGKEKLRTLSDRAKAQILATMTEGSPFEQYREQFEDPEMNLFYGAPTLVLVYTKPAVTAQIDGCLAAENLMLAAHAMGLGTCWIGLATWLLSTPELHAEFGVPAEYPLAAILIVGHPAAPSEPSERKPPEVLFRR